MAKSPNLAQQVAEHILSMITMEGRFAPGDKLPNELELSNQLSVSRTTLREAIRILVSHNVLEIHRGKGTFVAARPAHELPLDMDALTGGQPDIRALYEMRLIVEPKIAYYAAKRATRQEIARIVRYGKEEERQIRLGENRAQMERAFHQAIAQAAHNSFAQQLLPLIYQAIDSGVRMSEQHGPLVQDTVEDHRLIMDFIGCGDAVGAETAMRLHILRAMRGLGIREELD